MIVALVLAAGRGTRMGAPKATLRWGESTLLAAHARAAREGGCARVIAVVRGAIADALGGDSSAELVRSTRDDALGPAGSIAAAIAAVPALRAAPMVAVAPVDLAPDAWRALVMLDAALRNAPHAAAARPRYEGRGGHPVLLRGAVLDAFARPESEPLPTLRDVLRDLGPGVLDVSVDTPEVTADMDTPEDIARWRQ